VEWTAAQQDLLSAQLALVDAATTALFNQALIEQLTAQPLAER
jgi:cobalt-zinc-cadmium efflux system outer membrane protein